MPNSPTPDRFLRGCELMAIAETAYSHAREQVFDLQDGNHALLPHQRQILADLEAAEAAVLEFRAETRRRMPGVPPSEAGCAPVF